MMEHAIAINNDFTGTFLEDMNGLGCALTIVATPDILVKPKYVSASKTFTRTYQRFTFPVSDTDIDAILAVLETATLLIELYTIGVSGDKYIFSSDEKPLSEFKIDIGPNSKTITVTSDSTILDYSGSDFTLATYASKTKTNVEGGTFTYEINPLNYKYVGVGKILTEGGNSMNVVSKRLVITIGSAKLTIEAVQI